jgi:hypothetical protein
MAHDVFISHAHKDRTIADAICAKLESAQVKCWIAERDILAGEDRTEATRKAIGSSRVMVLVLSENANAAPHIEREIAHAFYTGRQIIPLRLTDTLPRRDFLFYLGNVRGFDAFNLQEELQLEALTATINGAVRGDNRVGDPKLQYGAAKQPLQYSDSWLGSLQATHYRTFEVLKRVAIAASVLAAGWLAWFVFWQTQNGSSFAEDNLSGKYSLRATPERSPAAAGYRQVSKPAYAYSRFGLWVPKSSTAGSTVEPPPEDGSSPSPEVQPQSSPSSPPVGATPRNDGDSQDGQDSDETSDDTAGKVPSRTNHRHEGHRGKQRPKSHHGKGHLSAKSQNAWVKERLKELWHRMGH